MQSLRSGSDLELYRMAWQGRHDCNRNSKHDGHRCPVIRDSMANLWSLGRCTRIPKISTKNSELHLWQTSNWVVLKSNNHKLPERLRDCLILDDARVFYGVRYFFCTLRSVGKVLYTIWIECELRISNCDTKGSWRLWEGINSVNSVKPNDCVNVDKCTLLNIARCQGLYGKRSLCIQPRTTKAPSRWMKLPVNHSVLRCATITVCISTRQRPWPP